MTVDVTSGSTRLSLGRHRALPADLTAHIGSLTYYQARANDYAFRRPDHPGPDYYLNYGDKYIHRFHDEIRPHLSPEGQQWCDRTMVSLQTQIEGRRIQNPYTFASLEDDSHRFRQFAFSTHPSAYLDSGLALLPVQDDVKIICTPDIQDLLSPEGVQQVSTAMLQMLENERPADVRTATRNTLTELVRTMLAYPLGHY